MLETKQFVRKELRVDGVQVTEENISDLARWAGGRVQSGPQGQFIKVNVRHPQSERQTKAFVGDWVLKAATGFKVYTEAAMDKAFDEAEPVKDSPPITDSFTRNHNVFLENERPVELRTLGNDVEPIEVNPRDAVDGKK